MDTSVNPPGHPGLEPRWTSSAKAGVGTATDPESRVLLSISHGILDEIYHPFLDHATTRDFRFIVTDGAIFLAEEKRHTKHEICPLAQGVPGYRLTNTCEQGRLSKNRKLPAHSESFVGEGGGE